MLIDQHGARLILLWFGTWKNGSGQLCSGMGETQRNQVSAPAFCGAAPVNSLSPHAPATLAADKRAFAALMRHLRTKDSERTLIMV